MDSLLSQNINPSRENQGDLIRAITEDFAPRFVPGSNLVYVGDTPDIYFDSDRLGALGLQVRSHEKMPDVLLHDAERAWLVAVEAVTSHGPIDNKRYADLTELFAGASAGIIYVTAFRSRASMVPYLREIAWHTEAWIADEPSHLIHFDGDRVSWSL